MSPPLEPHYGELWTSYLYRLLDEKGIYLGEYKNGPPGSSRFQAEARVFTYFSGHFFPLHLFLQREIKNPEYHQQCSPRYCTLEDILPEEIPLKESLALFHPRWGTAVTFDFLKTTAACKELRGPLGPTPMKVFCAYRWDREYPALQVVDEFLKIMVENKLK